jgi:minor extracellular serine protease Vpr
MDVVNLSLGGTPQGPKDFLSEALNAIVDAGVVAVVSAGNEGPEQGTVGSPGTAREAITVGAVTNTHLVGRMVEVGDLDPFAGALGDFDPFIGVATPLPLTDWRLDGDPESGRACSTSEVASRDWVGGTVVLIDRGVCAFTTKLRNAEAAGALGVLIVNNVAGPAVAPAHDGSIEPPQIAALGVSRDDGADARDELTDDPALTVTVTGDVAKQKVEGDVLAGFSSRGPTPFTRELKPEIVAPGVNIVSSVFSLDPLTGERTSGWAPFQGTSMAAPHVAGAAALLLHGDPGLSPEQVKSALVNRAVDLGYEVLEQGAGRLDVGASYGATVFAEPAAISFAHTKGNTNREIPAVTVQLTGPGATSCTAVAGAPAQASAVSDGAFTVSLPAPRTLVAGDNSGVVTVTCGGDQQLRIPWYARVDRNR